MQSPWIRLDLFASLFLFSVEFIVKGNKKKWEGREIRER